MTVFTRVVMIFYVIASSCNSPAPEMQVQTFQDSTQVNNFLPSWSDASKKAIVDFVEKTTRTGSPEFVAEADRIACFDNDGTLWGEQPMYFQLAFIADEIKRLAPSHPEWASTRPFKAVLAGDMESVFKGGEKALLSLVQSTHGGISVDSFQFRVKKWIDTARHPITGKHYNEMVYKPMVELLAYLRANGFKTFIVSGGGLDFMRAWAEDAYGIPPYQIIGSYGNYQFIQNGSQPDVMKIGDVGFIDDKGGKPIGIARAIGKRPIFSAGNSDGDYEMLQYTTSGSGKGFGMIIHHTDSAREYAYDRQSKIGHLAKGLDSAAKFRWLVVDMKQDWKTVY